MKEKRKNQKSLIRFFILLFILLLLTFSVHTFFKYLLNQYVFSNRIIDSYLLNFCLGYFSYVVLILSLNKHVTSLGFIFMFTSFAKFVVFYLVFKADYSSNGDVEIAEFLTIMIPYAFTLIAEIYSMSKVLKN